MIANILAANFLGANVIIANVMLSNFNIANVLAASFVASNVVSANVTPQPKFSVSLCPHSSSCNIQTVFMGDLGTPRMRFTNTNAKLSSSVMSSVIPGHDTNISYACCDGLYVHYS